MAPSWASASPPQRRLLATALWLAGVAGPGRGPTSVDALALAVLGVEPGNEGSYSGNTFRCLDGKGGTLPAAAINDEACDCADGSDEPGTGACAGQDQTLFFCANKGSLARRLYASRVGDGVCDCCDGSDEASLAKMRPSAKCADFCTQEGAQKNAEREEKVKMLRRALQRQDDIRQEGLGTRDKILSELELLKADLPEMEQALEVAKKAADVEREVERQAEAAKKAAEEAAKNETASKLDPGCMWRQTAGCAPDGDREAANDKSCTEGVPKGNSGYCDCNGDGELNNGEQGYTCEVEGSAGTRSCSEVCLKETTEEAAEEDKPTEEAASEEEKPQVSEYSKWMDGAADKMAEKDDEKQSDEKDDKQVSEYAKWMDGAGEGESSEGEASAEAADTATSTEEESEAKPDEATKEETAVEKESAAQRKVTERKDKIQEQRDSLESLAADKLGYATLHNKKLTRRVSEFNYDIEFFSKAQQDSVSLGSWSKWTGPRSAVFEEGTMCWGGPARKLNVNFVCGEKEEILDVFEPSRCVYEATIEHPGACEHAELEMLAEGKQVAGPKDEL